VIHRDLKPGNVLVGEADGRPVPKVIDFGIAKAAGEALTGLSVQTGLGVVGTPEYMAPEQATLNNLDVDTRADVYGLGALLYELLAGTAPFTGETLRKAGLLEMLRVVREEDPPRPSARLSAADGLPSLAADRGTEPRRLTGMLRTDLDWIVMKALEKDRRRRYDTATGFAADIRRYLAEETVLAAPPGRLYRLRKFVRRNRAAVAVGIALATAVGAGVGGLIWAEREKAAAATREKASEQRAAVAATRSATQARLLVTKLRQLLESPDPALGGGPAMTVRQMIDEQVPRLFVGLEGQSEAEAELRETVGRTYLNLVLPDQAIEYFEQAVHLRRAASPPDPPKLAEVLTNLADAYTDASQERPFGGSERRKLYDQAEATAREAVALQRGEGGTAEGLADALLSYSLALYNQAGVREPGARNYGLFRETVREGMEVARRCPEGHARDRRLARFYELQSEDFRSVQSNYPAAIDKAQEAVALREADRGSSRLYTARARLMLGWAYLDALDFPQAERQLKLALDGYAMVFGGKPDPYSAIVVRLQLSALAWQYKDEAVAELLRRYPPGTRAQSFRAVLAVGGPYTWGSVCLERGDYAEAERHFRDALTAGQGRPKDEVDGLDAAARYYMTPALIMQGKWRENRAGIADWVKAGRELADTDSVPPGAVIPVGHDPAIFFADLLNGASLLDPHAPPGKVFYRPDAERARKLLERPLKIFKSRPTSDKWGLLLTDLCARYILGDYSQVVKEMPPILKSVPVSEWHARRIAEWILAEAHETTGNPQGAVATREAAVKWAEAALPPGHPEVAAKRVLLADTLSRHNHFPEAAEQLERAYKEYTAHSQAESTLLGRRIDVADRLVEVYKGVNDSLNAKRWLAVRQKFPPGVTPYPRPITIRWR
jgi:tetratricopeptide (TPR) repeat protein